MKTLFETLTTPWLNKTAIAVMHRRGLSETEILINCSRLSFGNYNPNDVIAELDRIRDKRP